MAISLKNASLIFLNLIISGLPLNVWTRDLYFALALTLAIAFGVIVIIAQVTLP